MLAPMATATVNERFFPASLLMSIRNLKVIKRLLGSGHPVGGRAQRKINRFIGSARPIQCHFGWGTEGNDFRWKKTTYYRFLVGVGRNLIGLFAEGG